MTARKCDEQGKYQKKAKNDFLSSKPRVAHSIKCGASRLLHLSSSLSLVRLNSEATEGKKYFIVFMCQNITSLRSLYGSCKHIYLFYSSFRSAAVQMSLVHAQHFYLTYILQMTLNKTTAPHENFNMVDSDDIYII